jgi:hypothetical protein
VSHAVSGGAERFSLSLLHPLLHGFSASQGHGFAHEPDDRPPGRVFLPQDEPCPSPSGGVVQPELGTLAIAKMALTEGDRTSWAQPCQFAADRRLGSERRLGGPRMCSIRIIQLCVLVCLRRGSARYCSAAEPDGEAVLGVPERDVDVELVDGPQPQSKSKSPV